MTTVADQSSHHDVTSIDSLQRVLDRWRGRIDRLLVQADLAPLDASDAAPPCRPGGRRRMAGGRAEDPDDPEGCRIRSRIAPGRGGRRTGRPPPGLPVRRGRRPAELDREVGPSATGAADGILHRHPPRGGRPGPRDIQVTAIYTQLLEAVLAFEADPATAPRSQGPMADVLRLGRTMERHATRKDPGWALQAVADQLSYDAALIRLSRKRGIDARVDAFDFPEPGTCRARACAHRTRARRSLPAGSTGPDPAPLSVSGAERLRCPRRRSAGRARSAPGSGWRRRRPGCAAPCPAWSAGSTRSS